MRNARTTQRHGLTLVYATILMVVLCSFVSLGVDWGRAQLVKTELQRGADAAARYACGTISTGTSNVIARAQVAAADNLADNSSIVLQSGDIEVGYWDSNAHTFTSGGSPNNAVRVTANRNNSRGNAVPLMFARVIGVSTYSVKAVSVAYSVGTTSYGIIGLNNFSMITRSYIDSYNSSTGTYTSGTARGYSVCKCNSDITLQNTAQINGDAHAGIGKSVTCANNSTVTGNTASLASTLNYADVDTSSVSSSNNNGSLSSSFYNSATRDFTMGSGDNYTLPAGTYYLNNLTMKNNSTLACAGAVTIYTTSGVTLQNSATFTAFSNRPGNTRLRVAGTGNDVHLKNTSSLQADLYDPHGQYNGDNNTDFYGVMMVNDVSLANQAGVHEDESVSGTASGSGSIEMVK